MTPEQADTIIAVLRHMDSVMAWIVFILVFHVVLCALRGRK